MTRGRATGMGDSEGKDQTSEEDGVTESAAEHEGKKLTIDEIVEDAMTFLDFGPEVMTLAEPDGYYCDMEPGEFELARASIAFLSYRLLLMHRIKHGNVRGNPGGWIGVRHYQCQTDEEIASVLGIRGTQRERIDEVRRLHKVASKARNEDEAYRARIDGIMQDIEERYGLDADELGIVFL